MALPRSQSVAVGLAMIGVVYASYDLAMPTVVDHRAGPGDDPDAASAEKAARWTAGSLVALTALITKDATVFIMGGAALVAFSWMHRHANAIDPTRGAVQSTPSSRSMIHNTADGVSAGYTPGT